MIVNGYLTLQDFKEWIVTPNQDLSVAVVDDKVIERLIQNVCRHIDDETGRHFYPTVETRYFDTPENTEDDRVLWLDDDLLAAITVTNGDDVVLLPAEYKLYPANRYPKYALRIKESSDYYWVRDDDDNTEQVIDVLGIWGHHNNYAREGWATGSTLDEGGILTAADLTWTMAAVAPFEVGNIVKIENELCIVSAVGATGITVRKRGDNGSTAATHIDTTPVTIWQTQDDIAQAAMEIAVSAYHRRWGVSASGTATITGAGVVITPQDVPSWAAKIIASHARAF